MNFERHCRVPRSTSFSLKRRDPADTGRLRKSDAEHWLQHGVDRLSEQQSRLYAQSTWAVLIVLQGMDASGKDSTIKHVMSGVNPQGCSVHSFKAPTRQELAHDFLWRTVLALPARGCIGIHNRSHYEEVVVTRVHPEILDRQSLPPQPRGEPLWRQRFRDINRFERYLTDNGTIVLKFFLHLSKSEQRQRFLDRLDEPEKFWKFQPDDVRERRHWRSYMSAYEHALRETNTPWAPWYVVPADHKWFTRLAVAEIIVKNLERLKLRYPAVPDSLKKEWRTVRKALEKE